MKIAMLGAGGVGGYFGARLALAGHDVCFVARGAHAKAMGNAGLRIRSEHGDAHLLPAAVFTDSRDAGEVDLVVIAVKLWDTDAAARAAMPLLGSATSVVSLQNGIDKDEVLAAVVGRERVLGGVTYVLANLAEPGLVVQTGKQQRVILGELDGSRSTRVEAAVAAFASGGIVAEASQDIRRATWEKFAFLATNSAVTAVTRQTIGAVRSHPATRELVRDAMLEVVDLARREGVAIADDFVDDRMRFVDSLPAAGRASMAQDLLRGNRLELEWLSGAVVRRAERLGMATPVHRALHAALVLYANGAPAEGAWA
jgi:2-dehydropantoate 2-reductase